METVITQTMALVAFKNDLRRCPKSMKVNGVLYGVPPLCCDEIVCKFMSVNSGSSLGLNENDPVLKTRIVVQGYFTVWAAHDTISMRRFSVLLNQLTICPGGYIEFYLKRGNPIDFIHDSIMDMYDVFVFETEEFNHLVVINPDDATARNRTLRREHIKLEPKKDKITKQRP